MTMTNWEIVRHYREAKDRKADIRVLADLNATDKNTIIEILEKAGEIVQGVRRKEKFSEKIGPLYEQGLSDREIAERAGCAHVTVGAWRRKRGLLPN